jgi:hypothetical protein
VFIHGRGRDKDVLCSGEVVKLLGNEDGSGTAIHSRVMRVIFC